MANGGIDTEADYPYTATDGECIKRKMKRHVVTINGFEDVPANDEKALKKVSTKMGAATSGLPLPRGRCCALWPAHI